ncbi:MAG: sodium-independent anion transporter [Bacteroidetes bacterium 4572_112]|nr:MAG: sodium-independent anion transporter [Bacteroidetes bacterium 4572_112]
MITIITYKSYNINAALALVPEAIAFAFIVGISPIIGLYGAFMMALITAIIGGRPGMISGATGAMAVVMVNLVSDGNQYASSIGHTGPEIGLQFLFVTLLFTGLFQILAGVFKLGKYVRMIPHPVMMGFVNGLAIVIMISQLGMFKVGDDWMQGEALYTMIALVAATMLLMVLIPKISKKIPATLIAILMVSGVVIYFGIDTQTVRSFVAAGSADGNGSLAAELPSFAIPIIPFTWTSLKIILPYALILSAIGLIESLMTMNLIDELTESHGNGNKECIAQGTANMVNGFFGGMGGCAMIGQSIINIKSGGRGRLSGIVAGSTLLVFILFASSYIEMVPIAALVGVMFMVVIGTFAWSTFKIIGKIPTTDLFVIAIVTLVTVLEDLAVAVLIGIVVSALVFAWQNALRIRARKHIDERGIKHYEIYGPLFFASTKLFTEKFDVKDDPNEVIIDFKESRIMDQSAIEAINKIAQKYQAEGKTIHLRHLSKDCTKLIKKAEKICVVNVLADPDYFVSIDDYNAKLKSDV